MPERKNRKDEKVVRGIIWGLIVVAIGLWIWLANLGVLTSGIVFRRDWPVIIIIVGLLSIAEAVSWIIRRRRP
ncbi:MAG: DUF5668 domain-containing protein [candidate division WOR-3 bacterium]